MEDADDDIAVIGIGCNFPGGDGLNNFWRVLSKGENCVVDIPADRFDRNSWYDADDKKPGKTQTCKAALIDGFNEFDHKFFGIAEAEADVMDPQQKLLLQCAYRALEDAGIPMERISGSRTGVYIGLMNRDYEMLRSNRADTISHYNATGTATSIAANRISFVFNLTGPSFAMDSACSSSLVAVHIACLALKQADCEMALCGGVNCIIEPRVFVALSKARMISADGTSKPFSRRADGYGRGEGCGVLLLKPLKNALRDSNKIWGIVAKTAINQDGQSVSPITKPSLHQQQELLQRIYSQCELATVQYIEAHGTGTPVGDPTELASISNIIAQAKHRGPETLWIGSVKGNIGHTESAAGVAGLIKVLLMMRHQTIVPSVFYSKECPVTDTMRMSVPTKAVRWLTNGKRVAGVNSFGFGGTNAHVLVREHREVDSPSQIPKDGQRLFVTSAASEKSLIRTLADTRQMLLSGHAADVQALCYTSACGRSHRKHKYRKAILTSSLLDLQHQLAAVKAEVECTKSNREVVFVFSGNGVAFRGMCKELFLRVPVFQDKVREVEILLQKHNNVRISQWFTSQSDTDNLSQPDVVQPLLFAAQVAITSLLKHWGVQPDMVLGHSLGEVAAAHCSGLLSLEDAVNVVYQRSSLQSRVTVGKMLVVSNIAVEKVLSIITNFSGGVCVAAFNSPLSCTLSGDADVVSVLYEKLKVMYTNENIFLHFLDVPAAYHSHLMDPILEDVQRNLDYLVINKLGCKLFSTVTGHECGHGDFATGTYWAKNIREPVLFEQTLRAVAMHKLSGRNMVFVEIGPRKALQRNILETLGYDSIVLSSVEPLREYETILSTVGKLFELGVNVHWQEIYSGCETPLTVFPVYHFDNVKKELYFEDVRNGRESPSCSPHLLESQIAQNDKYKFSLSVETAAYLWEHKFNGVAVVPGAFFVALAFTSLMAHLKPKKPVSFVQISMTFLKLLHADNHQLIVTLAENEFKIRSPAATHALGTFRCTEHPAFIEEPSIHPERILKRCTLVVKTNQIYSILSRAGLDYGSVFKHLHNVYFGDEFKEAMTRIKVPQDLLKHIHDYFLHPVLLDYFMQMTAVVAMRSLTAKQGLPSAIGSVVISAPAQEDMFIYMRATRETQNFLEVCGCFAGKGGEVLVELKEVRITFIGNCSPVLRSVFFHNEMIPIPVERSCDWKIRALVFADKLGIAEALMPYLHPESLTVDDREDSSQLRDAVLHSLDTNLRDFLFIWAADDLSNLSSDRTLERLVSCCELFRQVVLTLKEGGHSCMVRVITYRSSEKMVDCVSAGFVLAGMTRACAAEIPAISFQVIDLTSLTREDIECLVGVINVCKQQELIVGQGKVSTMKINCTPTANKVSLKCDRRSVKDFVLQTCHPYRLEGLTATPHDMSNNPIPRGSIEVQITNVCVHSSDYFPVTFSQLYFGETLYWNNRAAHHHHTLLALDFSGVVTAVGKDAGGIKVGDRVASCYPTLATTRVVVPESLCYDIKTLPFLEETPIVSFFILAREILQRAFPALKAQKQNKMSIITPNLASVFLKVLALTANRSGWNVSCLPHLTREASDPCQAFVFLPPVDKYWQELQDDDGHERHIVLVNDTHMLSSRWGAFKSNHVHILDVTSVLQRAYLNVQGSAIFRWLTSLGFDRASLPVKSETFQTSRTAAAQNDDSYFATKTVCQVVLEHSSPVSDIPLVARPRQLFKNRHVYIVTGGLTGLGLETVKFIASNGGGYIVTLSRRMPTHETQSELDLIQGRYGVIIMNVQCDVSVQQQVVDAISKIEGRFSSCPIKGVFHSAVVLHDALIDTLNEALLLKVLKPKVSGALNLHRATLTKKLDFFVCYSSISSVLGNEAQSNYAAANSFLDAFCHYRRNLGLAGQSINWGPFNLGLLLNKDHLQNLLKAKGLMVMDACEFPETLAEVLLTNRPQQLICKFNFKSICSQNNSLKERLCTLVEDELGLLQTSSPHGNVRRIVSDVSNFGEDELDDDVTLGDLGIDSMLAMTLQSKIYKEMGINVPLVRILEPNTTVATLERLVMNN
ncbi:phenolphthiocerol synthesis polyketide synthase type I Pks15/1 [Nerophis ophidion]|uniref:phenolphthiocerol synthesis polyketide synthase type I Pks15/1 n=1 Tax=Nerophis ophidion TaxID=159077 RepID=UPI002AE06BCD|nr:phenolphthiocerol synthesis polyketide synthase type I Pks15/1 [Nerophis ophidion]